ncbi:MAG TPA: hypothetical protein VFU86_05145 [Terriglobales bacterium]|nr:hypothetical protein [Terriglobales bacterium]
MSSQPATERDLNSVATEQQPSERTSVLLSATSFAGGIIQGACAILVASSTAKIFLGIAGLAAALKTSELHANIIRLPLMAVSAALALVTLFVLWNAHRMRNRSTSSWRKRALTARQKAGIIFSFAAAVLTLVLVVAEITIHPVFGR